MSLRKIPDRLLNTNLHIIRDEVSIDDVGDAETIRRLAYGSMMANVQPETGYRSGELLKFEVRGKVYQPTHKAYFNRFQDGIKRQIIAGDYAIDTETDSHYLIISVEEHQSARRSITDSHHIKLILRKLDSRLDIENEMNISSKARIT